MDMKHVGIYRMNGTLWQPTSEPQASTAYNWTNGKSTTADGEIQEQITSAKVRNLYYNTK